MPTVIQHDSVVVVRSDFVGSSGSKMVSLIQELVVERFGRTEADWCHLLRDRIKNPSLGSWLRRYFTSSAHEGTGFASLVESGQVTGLKFLVADPDFDHYYWSPESRRQVASLVIGFYIGDVCTSVRVIVVHVDGHVQGIRDFGPIDPFFMPNNMKYHGSLREKLRQYVAGSGMMLLPTAT